MVEFEITKKEYFIKLGEIFNINSVVEYNIIPKMARIKKIISFILIFDLSILIIPDKKNKKNITTKNINHIIWVKIVLLTRWSFLWISVSSNKYLYSIESSPNNPMVEANVVNVTKISKYPKSDVEKCLLKIG